MANIYLGMPLGLRLKYGFKLSLVRNNKEKRMKILREISGRRKLTIPRREIPWEPSIDHEKCNGCKICEDFCPKGVFDYNNHEEKAEVARGRECVFLCTGCLKKCHKNAITFPDKEKFKKYIYYV